MWESFIARAVEGVVLNGTYASAGYIKARQEEDAEFQFKNWARTIVTGVVPALIVMVLGYFGVEVPYAEGVALLSPALDKLLRLLW